MDNTVQKDELTNGLLVGGALAAQTGSDVEDGTFIVRKPEIVTVYSGTATLTGTPVGTAGAEIGFVYKKNMNGSLGTKYEQDATASGTGKFSYADKTTTFFEGDVTDGDEIVVFYDEEVEAAKISILYFLSQGLSIRKIAEKIKHLLSDDKT